MSVEASSISPIEYTMTPGLANSHLIEIQIQYFLKKEKTVDFAIPAWRPGRYLLQNYARNIQEFSAVDEHNKKLSWAKTDKNTWRVECSDNKKIFVRYKMYANTLDAGSTLYNEDELYWNGTNIFMYVVGQKDIPTKLSVKIPNSWKVACGLEKNGIEPIFLAPNYDTLADAPGLCSPTLDVNIFDYDKVHFYVAIQGELEYPKEKLLENFQKIVTEFIKIFGKVPYTNYWFICHSIPGGHYHGVEHLNSTSVTFPTSAFSTPAGINNFYSLIAHELFHSWNGKRIRPKVLGPFDYSKEIYTRNLWVVEGITSYYDNLICKRAGIFDAKTYLSLIAKDINNQQNSPGRKLTSLAESSFDEWLTPDDSNNVEISFYTKGSLLGLILDLEIRRITSNQKSLDDVMRSLRDDYLKDGNGYSENEFQKTLEKITDYNFVEFFERYVYGLDELPYNEYLKIVGLELVETKINDKVEASLGVKLSGDEKQTLITNVIPGEAGFLAGLDKDDILLAIDGRQANISNINNILSKYKPNDTAVVHVFRRGRLHDFKATLQGNGNINYEIRPIANVDLTSQKIFTSWLNENLPKT